MKDLRNHTRDGASHFTEAGPLPVMGGRVELLSMRSEETLEYEATHRDEFYGAIHQDKNGTHHNK